MKDSSPDVPFMTPKIGGGKISYTAYRADEMSYSDTREVFFFTSAPIGNILT